MPSKQQDFVHKTAKGRTFNMDQFRQKNELTPAVGNIQVNARGDELGPGGKIVRKRVEVLDEYYRSQTMEEENTISQHEYGLKEEKPKTDYKPKTSSPTPAEKNAESKTTATKTSGVSKSSGTTAKTSPSTTNTNDTKGVSNDK